MSVPGWCGLWMQVDAHLQAGAYPGGWGWRYMKENWEFENSAWYCKALCLGSITISGRPYFSPLSLLVGSLLLSPPPPLLKWHWTRVVPQILSCSGPTCCQKAYVKCRLWQPEKKKYTLVSQDWTHNLKLVSTHATTELLCKLKPTLAGVETAQAAWTDWRRWVKPIPLKCIHKHLNRLGEDCCCWVVLVTKIAFDGRSFKLPVATWSRQRKLMGLSLLSQWLAFKVRPKRLGRGRHFWLWLRVVEAFEERAVVVE